MNKRRRYKAKARRLFALRIQQGKWVTAAAVCAAFSSVLMPKLEIRRDEQYGAGW